GRRPAGSGDAARHGLRGGGAGADEVPMTPTLRVLLAEDETLVRQGIRKLLELDPRFDIVAEAGDGQEALLRIREARPDVVLLDVRMPKLDGLGVLRALQQQPEAPPCLVLTTFDDRALILEAIREG